MNAVEDITTHTTIRTLDDLDIAGKRVLLRVDFNVPMASGRIVDRTRIDATIPTINEILDAGASVIVISHLGRPGGQPSAELSLAPLVPALSEALGGRNVDFTADMQELAERDLAPGAVVLVENLRFHAGEEANDPEFVAALAALADIYVDDAFSCAHRAHASIDGVARLLPAAAGRLMELELTALGKALEYPERPVMAIVGGNKISTKLGLLTNLVGRVDHLVIGGAMATTFLAARGHEVGSSLYEPEMTDVALRVLSDAEGCCTIHLPVDGVTAAALATGMATETVDVDAIPDDQMMLDIGPRTVAAVIDLLAGCKTLVWNGPLGAFEVPPFDAGTRQVATAAAELTEAGKLLSVAGGGDTISALNTADAVGRFSYVSTAGGAFLEWMEGRRLPGISVLAS